MKAEGSEVILGAGAVLRTQLWVDSTGRRRRADKGTRTGDREERERRQSVGLRGQRWRKW